MGFYRVLLYMVGRVITGVLAGLAFSLDYSGGSISGIRSGELGLIGLIAFGVFVLLTVIKDIDYALQPHPRIEYDGVSLASARTQTGEMRNFVRLAFKNKAKNPIGVGSIAQSLTAHISIFDSRADIVDDWEGRWAILDEPLSYSEVWQLNRYDLQPNNQQVILDIGFRVAGSVKFQGHDNFQFFNIGQPRRRQPPGLYKLKVTLAASNMRAKDFWFNLNIPQQTDDKESIQINSIKKPRICKTGSQT